MRTPLPLRVGRCELWIAALFVAICSTAQADFINGVYKNAADPWWSGTVNYNNASTAGTGNGAAVGAAGGSYNHVDLQLFQTQLSSGLNLLFTTTYQAYTPGGSTLQGNAQGVYAFSVYFENDQPASVLKGLQFQIVDQTTGTVGSPQTAATFINPTPYATGTNALTYGGGNSKGLSFSGSPGNSYLQGQTYFFTVNLANSLTSLKPTGAFLIRITANPEPRSIILAGIALFAAVMLWRYRIRKNRRRENLRRMGIGRPHLSRRRQRVFARSTRYSP